MTTDTYDRRYERRTHEFGMRDRFASGWGPVLSGAAAAFLTFITFSALWLAIGVSAGDGWISGNLAWFEFATSLLAAAVGGFVTGWLQPGDRLSGMLRGFASWGLVLVAGLVVGVPASTAIFAGATNVTLQSLTQGVNVAGQLGAITTELWATFAIFGGGAVLAAITGAASATSDRRTDEHRGEATAERTPGRRVDTADRMTADRERAESHRAPRTTNEARAETTTRREREHEYAGGDRR